jgi:hypothetical protein
MFVAGAAEGIDLEKKLVSVGEEQLQSLGFEGPRGIWFQVSTCTIILYYIILYYIILYYVYINIYI